jgi:phenylalanyl-tRNA synthetase beta chain
MPTVTLNKKIFEKLVGKKLSEEELKDRISMLGTDLEEVTDKEIIVEVFPNRPDLLSEQGFARAFASFIGEKKGLRDYKVTPSGEKVIIDKSVNEVRPYTVCAIVKNLNFTDEKIREVIQLQEKLHVTHGRKRKKCAIGIYPMEKIKYPIRFMAKKPDEFKFIPLEFEKELTGAQILSQHPTGRDYGHLLEGKEKYPFFIDANDEILSMPPIVNSHKTGKINEDTKEVFIECSGFDLHTLNVCLNIIVTSFADMGGEIYSMTLEYPDKKIQTPNLEPEELNIDYDYINKRLGVKLTKEEINDNLEKMGYGVEEGKALIPAYRADVIHKVDLVEDVAIAYGYENFEPIIPDCATIGQEDKFAIFKRKISEILVGLGLIETNTNNITNKKNQEVLMNTKIKLIELENALSTDYNCLRAWVIPSQLEVLSHNKHNEYPQNIFTIGTIFKGNQEKNTGIEENERLCVAICEENVDFTKIKQVFDLLFRMIDAKYEIEPTEHDSFISGRVGRVSVKGKKIAYIGEINPEVLANWKLEMPVGMFELNITELYELIN